MLVVSSGSGQAPATQSSRAGAGRNTQALTGVRFFAACAVLCYHFGPAWIGELKATAHIAVSIFFVLSGFVLACNYVDTSRPKTLEKGSFWVARFARIFPAYLVSLILSIPLLLMDCHGLTAVRVTFNCFVVMTLTQAWAVLPAMFWNFPAWSLSDEAFFYATFPWTSAWVRRIQNGLGSVLVCVLLLNVLCSALYLISPRYTFHIFPVFRLPQFLFGVVLGRAFVLKRALLAARASTMLALVAVAGLVAITFANGADFETPLSAILLMPCIGLMIYSLACGGGFLGACMSHPVLLLLGEASYSIYILQAPVFYFIRKPLQHFGAAWIFPVGSVALILTSIACFLLIEAPVREWIKRQYRPKAAIAIPNRAKHFDGLGQGEEANKAAQA